MPLPVEDLGQILADLVDVVLVLHQLIVHLLDEICAAVTQLVTSASLLPRLNRWPSSQVPASANSASRSPLWPMPEETKVQNGMTVLPVVVTVLVASEEAAALDAASLEAATDDAAEEATEELLTLLAELPEQEASSRAAADAPATCKNWRREILFFMRNTPLSM